MTSVSLQRLAPTLHYLTTYPPAGEVAESLRTTVFSSLGARTCGIWRLLDNDLVAVAQAGHTREDAQRYRVLPGSLDLLMWRAVRTDAPVITDGADRGDPVFATIDEEYWNRTLLNHDAVCVVRARIAYAGQPVGALGLILDQPWPDDGSAAELLDVVTCVLGIWMTSPLSGTREAAQAARSDSEGIGLAFSERQLQILRLVEQDVPTPQIARTLRVSESSVKQDLQAVMASLNARNRVLAASRARELGLL